MQDFTRLTVWQRAHQLALGVYDAVRKFPPTERYGLTAQMQRAAVSICANIAEGAGRGGDADFARFLHYAKGSANEVHYYLILARDLGLLPPAYHAGLEQKVNDVEKMLACLIRSVRMKDP